MPGLSVAGRAVAVTGGLGFIGRRLVERLGREGASRIVVIDQERATPGALPDALEVHEIRLGDASEASLVSALEGVQVLFHLAAAKHGSDGGHEAEIHRANVAGTRLLFEAARDAGVARTVFASSVYVYGRASGPPLRETEEPLPTTTYGRSKLAGELLGSRLARERGPEFVALRYFFTYGPEQKPIRGRPSFVVRTLERLRRGEPPLVRGDGLQALDYVYVDDVVDATMAVASSSASGIALNVGSGAPVTVLDLASRLQRVAGTRFEPVFDPPDETAGTSRVAAIDEARRVLGWEPRITLDEGLARTWEWASGNR